MRRRRQGWPAWLSVHDAPDKALKTASGDNLARGLARVAVAMGMIAALVGAGHLAAWLGGSLSQRGLSMITMKTNTALCLTLVGVALILLVAPEAGSTRRWIARAFAALALLLGFLTLVENLSGWNFGIDQLLAVETPGAIDVVSPNRMGTPGSLGFTLLGLALLLLSRRNHRGVRKAQTLALAVCLVGLLPTIGFLYGAQEFYGIARYTAIAWPTAVALLLLGLGLLCARPVEGLMAQVTADDPGGVSIRRLMPFFIALPLVLGWLRLAGERAGLLDPAMGTGIMVLVFIITFATLAYHAGRRASHSAQVQRESEERLLLAKRSAGLGVHDYNVLSGAIDWDEQTRELWGVEPDEQITYEVFMAGVHPDDRARVQAEVNAALDPAGSHRYKIEYRVVHRKDGTERWLVATGDVYFSHGRAVRLVGMVQDVTERKRAEVENQKLLATVQEERDRLTALLSSINDEIWVADAEKRLTLINPAVRQEFGPSVDGESDVEQIAARYEVYRPDGTPCPVEEAPPLRALRGEVVKDQEEIVRTPATGELRHRQVSAAPVRDAGGVIIGSVSVVRDITERKRAEEAVLRSQKTFLELVERAPFGIYIVDSQFRIAHMNAGSQDGAFRNVRPLIGHDFAEAMRILWPEDVAAGIIAVFRHTLETGEPYYSPRFVNPRHDVGTVEAYEWELHRMTLPDGQYGVICYYFDSTKLREAEAAARESEDRFRTMANAIPQLAWIAQADGYIVWYNQRWYQYTATTPEQMEGWGWQSVHDPVELPKVLEQWKASIATGEPFEMTFPLRGADGVFRRFLTRGFPLKDAAGRVVQWFGTNTDVDELKRAEEALRELNATLETRVAERTAELTAANQELEAFTYSVSHDLRAPLRHVTGFIELLEKRTGASLDPEGRRYVRVISEAAQRMGKLIDDLLMLSRVGRVALVETDVDLGRVVEEVREELAPEAAGRALEWQIGPLPQVRGDATLLRTVIANLLSNAIKYSRNRDPARIEIGSETQHGEIVCYVKDNGAGFDMRFADKLFGVFQRLHPPEQFEGSGIGLASVRRIVQRHGGRVWAQGEVDRGATFYFSLPNRSTDR